MQPRQTDAVDQFVAGEVDGYTSRGLLETESLMSMNRNEESSLPGIRRRLSEGSEWGEGGRGRKGEGASERARETEGGRAKASD